MAPQALPGPPASLAERAYETLRRRIVSCDIPPGGWVSEAQLAVDLGLGKTPIREALRRLASEGLVEPTHRRGYQVVPITISRVVEVFEAFGVIVPGVALLVLERASPEEKVRLARLTREWAAAEPGDILLETAPHLFFFELCGNPSLLEMTTGGLGHLDRMFSFGLLHGAFADPEYTAARAETLQALEGADPEVFARATRRVSDAARDSIIAALQASPAVMQAPLGMQVEALDGRRPARQPA